MFFALVTLGINYYFVSKCLIIKPNHSSQRKKIHIKVYPFILHIYLSRRIN
nr:MAG TPA: hypothetical protein [Caudoviricetes sp.]